MSRRTWNRIPIPPVMYEMLIHLALIHGYNERTLYRFIWHLIVARHADQMIEILQATEGAQGVQLEADLRARLIGSRTTDSP